VPESRNRRRPAYTAPPKRSPSKKTSPAWVAPVMLGLFLLGIAWLVVYYVSNGEIAGFRELGPWNLAIGFGLIIAGFALSTQWR
jgi:hypothetical protein